MSGGSKKVSSVECRGEQIHERFMNQHALENFGAYIKAKLLFDHVVEDMAELRNDPRCFRLIAQQVASADSVCANIEEGYGRLSRSEYIRLLDFARGSARETLGRYDRMKHWLDASVIRHRVGLADEIIAILTRTMQTLQSQHREGTAKTSYLRDDTSLSDIDPSFPRHSTPDTPPS